MRLNEVVSSMPVKKIHTYIYLLLAVSFGLMSFSLPGNHFTTRPISGTDYLSLTPDTRTSYGSDGYLLGHLLDMLAGNPETADEAPIKHFHYHYSLFHLHKPAVRHQVRQQENRHYFTSHFECSNAAQAVPVTTVAERRLPSYYDFLFRLTPF